MCISLLMNTQVDTINILRKVLVLSMNWRKPLIYLSLYAAGNRIPYYLKQIKKYEFLSREKTAELTKRKLETLLLHTHNNVPYYHQILSSCGVVKDNKVDLANFSRIPVLTKEIIRREGKNLYSSDYKKRKPYENTSGGSTGEPVRFIQDAEYDHHRRLRQKASGKWRPCPSSRFLSLKRRSWQG